MVWRVEVKDRPGVFDAAGEGIKKDILDLGVDSIEEVKVSQVYTLEGALSSQEINSIARQLLCDNIVQEFSVSPAGRQFPRFASGEPAEVQRGLAKGGHAFGGRTIEVAYNPGVMDPVEESTLKGIRDLGINAVQSVRTSRRYFIRGRLSDNQIKTIIDKLLCNKIIQHVVGPSGETVVHTDIDYKFKLLTVDLLSAGESRLLDLSRKGHLFLNLKEMRQIKHYFKRLKRNPTDCELETIAQTWSEHCGHKTFRGIIEYKEKTNGRFKKRVINNLLKSTIMKVTRELNKPWCVSVFHDNSGVIKFDADYNVCFKVETHNHPSALEPFGGANTGIGGVIRDPLGTGLGAKPILNTDVFCFGPPDFAFSKLPKGALHPKRIMKGVVSGVRDYGNKMGIPTVNGAILFDERFVGNPLVYCGTVGIIPKDKSFKKPESGDRVVLVGGRTGRDGIHGATFSSGELTSESEKISPGAVQIGNPIQEKKMLDVILKARDLGLYDAITDCGGGGLSSAVGEMGKDLGVRVDLEKVPLKYQGLSYTEIWISESQERMILSVPKKNLKALLDCFAAENVEATAIGEFTRNKRLQLFYKDNLVCDLDMRFLHDGNPKIKKQAEWAPARHKEPGFKCPKDLTKELKACLSHLNVCSKEWVIRQYDHEVQGGTIIKPLVGKDNDGPSDAAVVKPRLDSKKGLIISNGINFRYGMIDPYWMAASNIDEALRQIIACGGSLEQAAILDNFCWGNPDKKDRLGELVRAALAGYDIAKGFGVPFISGKDSLYNEYTLHNRSIAIPGTLLISAMAVMEDVKKAVTMDLKQAGDLIYIVGETSDELGGSLYSANQGFLGNNCPKVKVKAALKAFTALSAASSQGLIAACHDCSDGGLGVAAAEMSFAGGLGMELFLKEVPYEHLASSIEDRYVRNDFVLFSESNSRFIVEVKRSDQREFEKALEGVSYGLIGCVSQNSEFKVYGLDNKVCVKAAISELKESWKEPLRW
ncbi:MAG: phosphoribosylformylglycinamidine synthase subunit PurL [Candidatus Omnitrophota bacterium]